MSTNNNLSFKLLHNERVLSEFVIKKTVDIETLLFKITAILEKEYKLKYNTLMHNGKDLTYEDQTMLLCECFNAEVNIIKVQGISYEVDILNSTDDLRVKANFLKFQTEEIKNSDFYNYYTKNLDKVMNKLDEKLRAMFGRIKNFLERFKENVNISLRATLDTEDFQEMNIKCEKLLRDCEQILGNSATIQNFYEILQNGERTFKEIKEKEIKFKYKYRKVNTYLDCIKKSIDLIVKNNESFIEYYDYDSFIPYNKNLDTQANLDLEFNFIETNINNNDNNTEKEILKLVSNELPNLTEDEKNKVDNLQENYLDEKLDVYNRIKETACDKIDECFQKFTDELEKKKKNFD